LGTTTHLKLSEFEVNTFSFSRRGLRGGDVSLTIAVEGIKHKRISSLESQLY